MKMLAYLFWKRWNHRLTHRNLGNLFVHINAIKLLHGNTCTYWCILSVYWFLWNAFVPRSLPLRSYWGRTDIGRYHINIMNMEMRIILFWLNAVRTCTCICLSSFCILRCRMCIRIYRICCVLFSDIEKVCNVHTFRIWMILLWKDWDKMDDKLAYLIMFEERVCSIQ